MKKLLFIYSLFLSSFFCQAQLGELKQLNFPLSGANYRIVDMDNDGDIDVLTMDNSLSGKVLWLENVNGSFPNKPIIITNDLTTILSVFAEDLDNDGDKDVVVSLSANGEILWFENLGIGVWSKHSLSTQSSTPVDIRVFDFDNDGDNDIFTIAIFNPSSWHENLGGGVFASPVFLTNSHYNMDLQTKDLDNDGDIDLLFQGSGTVYWQENLGAGNFSSLKTIGNNSAITSCVFAIDMDNDGDLDILSGLNYNDEIVMYTNLGTTWSAKQIIITLADGVNDIDAIDFDNDGDIDIFATLDPTVETVMYENLGLNTFGSKQVIASHSYNPTKLNISDMDNDGDIDVFHAAGSYLLFSKNNGIGFDPMIRLQSTFSYAKLIGISDLDLDGNKDVITATEYQGGINYPSLAWYKNLGNGEFGKQTKINDIQGQTNACIGDIDGDGLEDIIYSYQIFTSGLEKHVVWQKNLGGGNISPTKNSISFQPGFGVVPYVGLLAVDIDNDLDIDLIASTAAGSTTGKIVLFENLGSGTFSSEQIIFTANGNASYIGAADFDNDGDQDIYVSCLHGNYFIAWYENLGSNSFGPQQIINMGTPNFAKAGDLNNDGDIDLLSGDGNQIFWHANLGGGVFGPATIITTQVNNVVDGYVLDIDGDGDQDILTAGDFVKLHENLGNGNFAAPFVLYLNSLSSLLVIAGDLDSDGDPEILIQSQSRKILGVIENYYNNPKLKGIVFYDANQNKLLDSNERGFQSINTQLQPISLYNYSDNFGNYFFAVDSGTYTVSYVPDSLWNLTTDSVTYTRTLSTPLQVIDSLNFGFYPDTLLTIIAPDLTGGFPRCNDTVNYWASLQNQGTTFPSGIIHVQLDDSVSYVSAAVTPDSINGQNIYWHYDSLFFYSSEMINLQVQMPPFTSMGDTLTSYLTVHELDTFNNIVYTNVDTLEQILVCAYDPNDKSVTPKGIGTEGFIPQNQELEYLIRFQNTGNDTAITVMVRDQLDANLDWSTLQPIASSDPVQIWIEQDGEAVFKFQNIMLPDSGADFLGSQGFVKFKISPDTGLAPLTPIYNTGHIYFDNNPAVITNTVLNTIECYSAPLAVISYSFPYLNANVTGNYTYQWFLNGNLITGANADTLMPLVDGNYTVEITDSNTCYKLSNPYNYVAVGIEELAKLKTVVYPNPFSESTTILFDKNLNGEYDLLVYDIVGREVKHINKIAGNKVEISKNEIGKGLFLAYVVNRTTGEKIFIEKLVVQ